MTQEQKLQKIIERAVANGYNEGDLGFMATFEKFGGRGWDEDALIFSHSFLKAYFGEEVPSLDDRFAKEITKEIGRASSKVLFEFEHGHCFVGNRWEFHAQILALTPEGERIDYLYKFMEQEDD